jgi:hypothetical protein
MKKNISYIIFALLLLDLFYIKAYFYGLIEINSYLSYIASFIPERVSFYLFLPFYYLFFLPINWLLFNLFKLGEFRNVFLSFFLDVTLTIIYLTIIFYVIKKFYKKPSHHKKKKSKTSLRSIKKK